MSRCAYIYIFKGNYAYIIGGGEEHNLSSHIAWV